MMSVSSVGIGIRSATCTPATMRALAPNQRRVFKSSGSAASKCVPAMPVRKFPGILCSHEIVKVLFCSYSAPQAEDLRRNRMGIDEHVIARALPEVVSVRDQIVGLKGPRGLDSQVVEVKLKPATMDMMGAQVDDHHEDIRSVGGLLAVGQNPLFREGMEPQPPVVLKGGIVSSDPFPPPDKFMEIFRSVNRPLLDLILL